MTELPTHVDIREVSLRDGLQIEEPIPLSAKLELLAAVAATGVREVEATAFVSPSKVPVAGRRRRTRRRTAPTTPTSSSPRWSPAPTAPSGPSPRACDSIEYVVSAADAHSQANVGRTSAEATDQIARDRRRSRTTAASPSRSSSPPHGTARSTGPPRRSGCSTSPRRPATAASTGSRSPTPSAPPRRGGSASLIAQRAPGDRRHAAGRALPQHPRRRAGQRLRGGRARASPGWTPRSAGWAAARSRRAPPATSPPRTWCTCCATADIDVDVDLQAAIAAAEVAQIASSATTCRARCCAPATGSAADARARRDADAPRAARPGRPSSRRPGSCSPSAAFTAPRWPTSPRPRASRRRCSTATSPTRKTCWPRWPSRFCTTSSTPSGLSVHLPDSPDDDAFFTAVVTGYWNMFKQNIGIMIAVAQLAATQQRFAAVQNEFRRFGMDIVAASVRRAQEQGYGADLDPEHTAAAIALLFENFTTVFVGTVRASGVEISDEDAIATLSTIWKKTLYGVLTDQKEINVDFTLPEHLPGLLAEMDAFIEARDQAAGSARTCSSSTSVASTPAPTGTTAASRSREWEDLLGEMRRRADKAGLAALRPAGAARRPRRHQPRHGGHPGAPGAQGPRAAQRPAERVVDRRQLPAGHHDGAVRHRRAERRSGPRR